MHMDRATNDLEAPGNDFSQFRPRDFTAHDPRADIELKMDRVKGKHPLFEEKRVNITL